MPTKEKKLREIVKFEADKEVQLTLDTDPGAAKSNTRDTEWGTKTSFTYFTKDDKVFFASEALHGKLLQYAKGDTVSITLVDGKIWLLTSDSVGSKRNTEINSKLESTESTILLRKIALDMEIIKSKLLGANTNDTTKETVEEQEDF